MSRHAQDVSDDVGLERRRTFLERSQDVFVEFMIGHSLPIFTFILKLKFDVAKVGLMLHGRVRNPADFKEAIMATNEQVEALIDDAYAKLVAAEAAHPNSPELAALHESLFNARNAAVEHFGLGAGVSARSGGGSKEPPPEDPNG